MERTRGILEAETHTIIDICTYNLEEPETGKAAFFPFCCDGFDGCKNCDVSYYVLHNERTKHTISDNENDIAHLYRYINYTILNIYMCTTIN